MDGTTRLAVANNDDRILYSSSLEVAYSLYKIVFLVNHKITIDYGDLTFDDLVNLKTIKNHSFILLDQIREIMSALTNSFEYNFFYDSVESKIAGHSPSDIIIEQIRNDFLEHMGTLRDVIHGPYFTSRLTAQEKTYLVDNRSFFEKSYLFLTAGLYSPLLV